MKLPANFKNIIARVFYDKVVEVMERNYNVGADGWVKAEGSLTKTGEFYGNVQVANSKQVQEELGLEERVDLIITCNNNVNISKGAIIRYEGVLYKVLEVKKRDSHNVLIVQK